MNQFYEMSTHVIIHTLNLALPPYPKLIHTIHRVCG